MSDYVNRPQMSEVEMNKKLEEIRANVTQKVDKWASRIQVSMSFTPKIKRLDGERWTENGKQWEMKGGIKMTVAANQDSRMPHWCPKCSLPMNHRFDRKFFYIRGWCFNCNVEFEGKMRLDGTWDSFEKRMLRENEKSWLRDKIEGHLTYIREFKEPTAYYENGGSDVLATKSMFKSVFADLEKDVEFMLARLEVIAEDERKEVSNEHV